MISPMMFLMRWAVCSLSRLSRRSNTRRICGASTLSMGREPISGNTWPSRRRNLRSAVRSTHLCRNFGEPEPGKGFKRVLAVVLGLLFLKYGGRVQACCQLPLHGLAGRPRLLQIHIRPLAEADHTCFAVKSVSDSPKFRSRGRDFNTQDHAHRPRGTTFSWVSKLRLL